jgi:hypothetical protein
MRGTSSLPGVLLLVLCACGSDDNDRHAAADAGPAIDGGSQAGSGGDSAMPGDVGDASVGALDAAHDDAALAGNDAALDDAALDDAALDDAALDAALADDGALPDADAGDDEGPSDAGDDAGDDGDADAGDDGAGAVTSISPILGGALSQVAEIGFQVVDAEYSRALDTLVAIADAPSALLLFDVEADTLYALQLPVTGACVSVSPDGTRAAIGYLGGVILVDLVARAILETYPLQSEGQALDVFDVVLAGNGYAYISPRPQSWTSLFALELGDGELHPSTGHQLYGGSRLDLHPDGEAVFAADNGISPSDIERWDIAAGPAVYVRDTPYHGTHGGCGKLAITDDGGRVIGGCSRVFAASPDPALDLLYRGSLELPHLPAASGLWHADHSGQAHRVSLLQASNTLLQSDRVILFEDTYLRAERVITMPTALAGGTQVPVRGMFGYFTQSGERLVALVRYRAMGETAYRMGITVLDAPNAGTVIAPPDVTPLSSDTGVDALGLWVTDAEYSDALDRIVLVAREPSALVLLDPVSLERTTLELPMRPTAISVSLDGLTAAVGHDAWISIVDLTVPAILDVVEVTAPLFDLVLADNDYAYGFPSRDQWVDLHSVSLADGFETRIFATLRDKSIGALHPDGHRVYTNASFFPAARFDTTLGPAALVEPPDRELEGGLCNDVTFADGGARLVTGCGQVYWSTADPATDMRYAGALERPAALASWPLGALDWSASAGTFGMVLAADRTSSSPEQYGSVSFYAEPYLTKLASRPLPPMRQAGATVRVDGRHVFYSADGTLAHALVEGATTTAIRRFGLSTFVVPMTKDASAAPQPPFADDYAGFDVLGYRVAAAAYSEPLNRLLLVAEDPPALHVINPALGTETVVALPLRAVAIAVAPSGATAVVGHDGWVSVVDISPPGLLTTERVSTRVTALALDELDRVFASRAVNGYAPMHVLDLTTLNETVTAQDFFNGGEQLLLHGSTTLYVTGGGVSRYDLGSGAPVFEGTKIYGYSTLCDYLAPTDDGQLITGCGYLMITSAAFADDLAVGARLQYASNYRSIDHASASGRFVSLPSDLDSTTLEVHDDTTLERQAVLNLPSFHVGSQTRAAHGRFVFTNAAGTIAYVVVQAPFTAGLQRDFAVVTLALP